MRCYAVIDTNVLVSALLSNNANAATVQLLERLFLGEMVPVMCCGRGKAKISASCCALLTAYDTTTHKARPLRNMVAHDFCLTGKGLYYVTRRFFAK